MNFENRTVVVTGASRGIGEATAIYFASRKAQVFLAARSADRIDGIAADLRRNGATAFAVPCDVSDPEQVANLVSTATRQTGRLDLLVNNAGLIDPIARLADSDPLAWSRVVDVNVKGVYDGLRFAIPVMVAQGGGTIINISSGAATAALEGWSHYCATKAAVLSLTRTADHEYRSEGVRVLGLSPGTVATHMQEQIRASERNPRAAADIVFKALPTTRANYGPRAGTESLMQIHRTFRGDMATRAGWGEHNLTAWDDFFKVLKAIGQSSIDIDTARYVTNDFIADANAFDRERVHADADAYVLPDDLAALDMEDLEARFYSNVIN